MRGLFLGLTAVLSIHLLLLSLGCCASAGQSVSPTTVAQMQSNSGVSVAFDQGAGILKLSNPHVLLTIDVQQGTLSYEAHGLRLIDKGQASISVDGRTYWSADFSW
ncbi:MAG: hypothetical protein ACP5Q1_10685, partial [Anaerolineae bacterium]